MCRTRCRPLFRDACMVQRISDHVGVFWSVPNRTDWGEQKDDAGSVVESIHLVKQPAPPHSKEVVALFNASDDTVEMVRRMLDAAGFTCLVGCHLAHLKKGLIDFSEYLERYQPNVVIIDISPPY